MSETLHTEQVDDDRRIRIVYHPYPDEPYDDGGSPILRIDHRKVEQVTNTTSYVLPDGLVSGFTEVLRSHDLTTAERYLRIFWGVRNIDSEMTRDFTYLAFDPAHWREAMELTDEYMAERKAADPSINFRLGNMDEYRAYLNGEVYGYVIEKRVTWQRQDDPTITRQEWEETDSCYGFYGESDYALEAAKEAL